jgi:nitroreductase
VGVWVWVLAAWVLPVLAEQGAGSGPGIGQTSLETIRLLRPDREKGIPVMRALGLRRSTRTFSGRALSPEHLSEVLWAAAGINRDDGKRTAPSAWNRHSVEVFAVLPEGVFRYVADGHLLERVVAGDFRSLTGVQEFVGTAPLNLVYVADLLRFSGISSTPDELMLMAAVEAGHMAENVYLYCASEGLGAVTRTLVPREKLGESLGLGSSQRIVSAQTVGYPE